VCTAARAIDADEDLRNEPKTSRRG